MNAQQVERYAQSHPEEVSAAEAEFAALLARSATDPQFRRQLLADSRTALREATGKELAESVNIVFVENQADTTIVLPDPITPDAELSEEELTSVAGGATTSPVCSIISIIGSLMWAYDEFVERDGE